jgi:hypothetical protein
LTIQVPSEADVTLAHCLDFVPSYSDRVQVQNNSDREQIQQYVMFQTPANVEMLELQS